MIFVKSFFFFFFNFRSAPCSWRIFLRVAIRCPNRLVALWGGDGTRDFSTPPSAKCPPPPHTFAKKRWWPLTVPGAERAGHTGTGTGQRRPGGGPGPGPGGCGGGVSRGPAVPGPIGSSPRTPRPVLPMCRNSPAATGSRFPRGGRAGGGASPGRSGAGPVPSRSRPGWPRGGRNSSRSRRFWVLGGFGDRRQSGRGCPPTGRQPGVAAPLRSPPDRLR